MSNSIAARAALGGASRWDKGQGACVKIQNGRILHERSYLEHVDVACAQSSSGAEF
ncbi:MAG: hypothetical protein M3Q91_02820 [Acidobacteriota bacterium]|nr:hypothetical protein [Acidobacteriota bacterium]